METEKTVTYLTEYNDHRDAILDIYMKLNDTKYAIRIMGPIHDKKIRKNKDEMQALYLKDLKYTIIDIWYHNNEAIFKRNRKKLTESQLIKAYKEMVIIFGDKLKDLSKEWLKHSEHRSR